AWHEQAQPGPLVLLPCEPGPVVAAGAHPLQDGLTVQGPAGAWVGALLAGLEVLEGGGGRALRRANGAVFLDGGPAAGGPLQRHAELDALEHEVRETEAAGGRAAAALDRTLAELAAAEAAFNVAGEAAERTRQQELEAGGLKGEAERAAAHARREAADAAAEVGRLSRRLEEVEERLATLGTQLEQHELERVRLDERLGGERSRLVDLEAQQEAAREATTLAAQQSEWEEALKERRLALGALETAAQEAAADVQQAEARLTAAEAALEEVRKALEALGASEHKLELERTEIAGRKRGLIERVEAEWRKPLDQLLATAPEVAGDVAWLRQENERLTGAIDAVGPVNALAVEEHA